MKQKIKQSIKNKDGSNLFILIAIALCIGVYLLITTVSIAKDSVTFINYAKQMETNLIEAIIKNDQHPGYPFLIITAHKIKSMFLKNQSTIDWIICAQSVTLIFRLLALVVLYYIGKRLFGAVLSLWAVLILAVLPIPAKYGSDALSDWPYLFFFVTGLFYLFKSAEDKKWRLFGLVGVVSGIGYLIRPECVQILIYGSLWLATQLFFCKNSMNKQKIVYAFVFLFIGFLIIASPYIILKQKVFPKKDLFQLTSPAPPNTFYSIGVVPSDIASALGKLFQNIGETLMWYFVPMMLIGMYRWVKIRKWYEPQYFFLISVLTLNVFLMIWLYCNFGYMSYRHTLSLLIIPVLYIPLGLREVAWWCQNQFDKKKNSAATNTDSRLWFLTLLLIGVLICAPKLLRPIRIEKLNYRAAAKWLKDNTNAEDIIAVPDERINFYAERNGPVYENEESLNGLINCTYIVKTAKISEDFDKMSDKIAYEYDDKAKKGIRLFIFKNTPVFLQKE